ncbi:hypothetical protein [Microcystis phage MJing1]|nr:hypothetical protein [Microcystis phage MJing1]
MRDMFGLPTPTSLGAAEAMTGNHTGLGSTALQDMHPLQRLLRMLNGADSGAPAPGPMPPGMAALAQQGMGLMAAAQPRAPQMQAPQAPMPQVVPGRMTIPLPFRSMTRRPSDV